MDTASKGTTTAELLVGPRQVPLAFVRNPRARRYVLRVRPDGVARVTIPRGGSIQAAKEFAERHTAWLARQLQRIETQPMRPAVWTLGSEILVRGEKVRLEAGADGRPGSVSFGGTSLLVLDPASDFRPVVEGYLWRLAQQELPPRVFELALLHQLTVRRVTVRNQATRWGSCSRRGTLSLNWRLVQTPAFVSDYIILHELMHLREMNHSPRFWGEVERACPEYKTAELWLKRYSSLLRH
ncbi:MAG: M48 family metallopeptidase [Verrucomicrobia bacterium]|nr:M48 family metallopeptidase [Verrucomicrobiota bacterium]